MIDRELATCYAMLGWYGKCAQLSNRLLEKMEQIGDHSFNGRVAKSLPMPTWQGQDTYSTECWERDIFGANNSREQSCHTSSNGRLVAARDFDAGDLVFIERPVVGYVAETKGQCNACTLKTMHT
uniref:Uncharacterized protein n=1 Tax=Anopheles atroparvus TaxID=41427 RepID=A0AAG5DMD6_ANOAO